MSYVASPSDCRTRVPVLPGTTVPVRWRTCRGTYIQFRRILETVRNGVDQTLKLSRPDKEIDICLAQTSLRDDDQPLALQFFDVIARLPLRHSQAGP
jgi:hypothetical protein